MKYIVCYYNIRLSIPLSYLEAVEYAVELAGKNLPDYPDPTKFNIRSEISFR
jgi:hypothetical protein